jgi:tRNA A-37 threonylcarbamoyl transferase component Bud32
MIQLHSFHKTRKKGKKYVTQIRDDKKYIYETLDKRLMMERNLIFLALTHGVELVN